MNEELKQLEELLHVCGHKINVGKTVLPVVSRACINKDVPSAPGVYWIETTMPAEEMRQAASTVLGKQKRFRKNPPEGTNLILQDKTQWYVAYSGTEANIQKRLTQHLFNEASDGTVRLGCLIDKEPFSKYKWRVAFARIDSYELRYAVEAWWRLNVGWPVFCLR